MEGWGKRRSLREASTHHQFCNLGNFDSCAFPRPEAASAGCSRRCGDLVRGQFLTQIAGKDVYVTLAGHLGAKDGYATFDATEVKVGDLSVPASLVNGVLQRKLAEQRDQLKLPNNVSDLKVENGELVLVEK